MLQTSCLKMMKELCFTLRMIISEMIIHALEIKKA